MRRWGYFRALLGLTLWVGLTPACTYHFSNLDRRNPPGIRTISIEAIYDTSHSVVPHEILWEALQRSFAEDGHLRLVSRGEADAYLRAQLSAADFKQTDLFGLIVPDPTGSPTWTTDQKGNPITSPDPGAYTNLKKAQRYAGNETVNMVLRVELWHLSKRELLLKKSYALGGKYQIYNAKVLPESQFIKAEEGFEALFTNMSRKVSAQIVDDVLSLTSEEVAR